MCVYPDYIAFAGCGGQAHARGISHMLLEPITRCPLMHNKPNTEICPNKEYKYGGVRPLNKELAARNGRLVVTKMGPLCPACTRKYKEGLEFWDGVKVVLKMANLLHGSGYFKRVDIILTVPIFPFEYKPVDIAALDKLWRKPFDENSTSGFFFTVHDGWQAISSHTNRLIIAAIRGESHMPTWEDVLDRPGYPGEYKSVRDAIDKFLAELDMDRLEKAHGEANRQILDFLRALLELLRKNETQLLSLVQDD